MDSPANPNSPSNFAPNAGFRSAQNSGLHRTPNMSVGGVQHPIRQPVNAREGSVGFGVIGSGHRGEHARNPVQYNVDAHAPAQRAAYSNYPPGLTPVPALPQSSTLAPFDEHRNSGSPAAVDQQNTANTGAMFRQLFNPTPVYNENHHSRAFTPTEEQLIFHLQRLGMQSNGNPSNDILDIARRSLEQSVKSPVRRENGVPPPASRVFGPPARLNEPPLSDSASNATGISGEPRTPASIPLNGFCNHAHRKSLRDSGPGNGPTVGSSLIDPYIPEMNGSGFLLQGHGSNDGPPWSSSVFDIPPPPVRNDRGSGSRPIARNPKSGTFPQALYANLEALARTHSTSSYDADSQNALYTKNEYLKKEIQELKRQAYQFQRKFEVACHIGMRNITVREAEIAGLKRQIRKEGLIPFNEIASPDNLFFEKEFSMLFRMLCCWGKRFYKFPTGEPLTRMLQQYIGQICEDPQNESFLMGSSQTKYLVVVSLAARWLTRDIFDPHFLDIVASSIKAEDNAAHGQREMRNTDANHPFGGGIRELMGKIKNDSSHEDRIYEAIQKTALNRANVLLDVIKPLMSRTKDKGHHEMTHKQFIQITQHAARIVLESAQKDTEFTFNFPQLGEAFTASSMKEVTGDTLGLDVAAKVTTPIWRELRGDLVRLCMLPHVSATVRDQGGEYRQTEIYKANVLLF